MTQKQFLLICEFAEREMGKTNDPQHDWEHVERVGANSVKIVEVLGLKAQVDLNLLLAACYLHDLAISRHSPSFFGLIFHHFFESSLVAKYLPTILPAFDLDEKDSQILFTAIKNHPLSFPYRRLNRKKDIYSKILQDADTIEFFSKKRLASFDQNANQFAIYKILSYIKNPVINYGLKNIEKFLNFPQLASSFEF